MTNEIKEIIEALKPHNDIVKEYQLTLSIEEQKLLLDYITDLQEENKHLNLQLDQALKDYEELQIKIDKALNFIKKQKPWWEEWHYDMCGVDDDIEEIVNILRGDE